MATLSNELKAVLFQENFLDNPRNVLKENCLVIQHFSCVTIPAMSMVLPSPSS